MALRNDDKKEKLLNFSLYNCFVQRDVTFKILYFFIKLLAKKKTGNIFNVETHVKLKKNEIYVKRYIVLIKIKEKP